MFDATFCKNQGQNKNKFNNFKEFLKRNNIDKDVKNLKESVKVNFRKLVNITNHKKIRIYRNNNF
jgi:hypothetical protein